MSRVFLVCDRVSDMGGIQRVVRALSDGFADCGHQVEIISMGTPADPQPIPQRHAVPETVLIKPRPWWPLLRKINFGPLNFRGMRPERISFLQKRHARRTIASIAQAHPDAVFIVMDLFSASIVLPSLSPHSLSVMQYHNSYAHLSRDRAFGDARRASGQAGRFLALTQEDAAGFREAGFENVGWMANPLSFFPEGPPALTDREKIVTAIGRFTPQKGFDILIEAWAKVQDRAHGWTLNLYGASTRDEIDAIQSQVEAAGVSQSFHQRGLLRDVEAALLQSRLYVLPSRYEGLPMVLLEAMSCATPCVATDCSPGVIRLMEAVGAPIAPRENPEALADAILEMIGDPDRMDRQARLGRDVARGYSLTTTIEAWEALFQSLREKRSR